MDDKFYVHHGFESRALGEWNINGRDRYLRESDFVWWGNVMMTWYVELQITVRYV